ncbi:small acidic protein-like [Mizuhopecten yessoensis]|uniref:Small acidic protein n=1 Tax=Mizuhopecten yessoensis TaxID=6573 RepID=A0A210QQE4_MIZYE|nr:small acidic protein-like [Mizuhopecten yessoensis]OWF50934.1 Small acidic protein [Mizuhopecten yessoensis]
MSEATNTDPQEASTGSTRPKECLDLKKVHSANSWEKVELGDDDRKKKFLRLMGAAKPKTQHQGRFVIGDQDKSHGRTMNDTDAMTSNLEKQFTDGLEHKFAAGPRAHIGLGFHGGDTKEKDSAEKCEDKGETKEEVKPVSSEARTEEKGRQDAKSDIAPKHKLEESSNNTDPDKPQIKMMKFVKSSS